VRTIPANSLKTVRQDDLVYLVRLLRALITNLRVYPEGHSIVQSVAGRVGERVQSLGQSLGNLLLGADSSLLSINNDSIYKACDEQGFSIELAAWLRERGVENVLLEPGATADEVLRLFGWLHRTDPAQSRTTLRGGAPRDLGLAKLDVNVRAPKTDDDIRQTLETMDLTPFLDKAGLTGEIDWTQTDLGRLAAEGKLDDLVDGERMEAFVDKYFEERFDPSQIAASRLTTDDIDAILDRLRVDLGSLDSGRLDQTISAKAAEAVARLLPDAVGSYLATELPAGGPAQQVRVGVLEQLRGDTAKQGGVLRELTGHLTQVTSASKGLGCLHAMEDLVPQALAGGDRTAAFDAVGAVAMATLPGRPEELRGRARMSLQYMASPELLRTVLHQLQAGAGPDRERSQDMLRVLAPHAITTLMEELRTSMRRVVRLELVDVLTHVGQRALMEGDDPATLLEPLVRQLDRHGDNPWYFTRNVVVILGSIGLPAFQEKLTGLMGADVDPRVRTEVARGLVRSNSDPARRWLAEAAFSGGLDPTGMAEVVPHLLRADPSGTLDGLQKLFASKDLPPDVATGSLVGLALQTGERAMPLLSRLLEERTFLRRPSWPEPVRLAAVEALGTILAQAARAALDHASDDKASAIRRRAAELLATSPEEHAAAMRERFHLEA